MEKVKIGDTIKIIHMEGEPQYTNREGVVTHIDDAGQIHGTWGGCAIIPEALRVYVTFVRTILTQLIIVSCIVQTCINTLM